MIRITTQVKGKHGSKGFTLIEILVVATIMGLLASVSFISYRAISKQGRDSTRKAQLEQIRSALEQYRSNNINGSYPDLDELNIDCTPSTSITDGTNTYLESVPTDPDCDDNTFYYNPTTSTGALCDSASSTTPCLDFTLASYLENGTTNCTLAAECGTGSEGDENCRYCLTPYGQE